MAPFYVYAGIGPNSVATKTGVDVTLGYTAVAGGTAYHTFVILTDRATGQQFATRAGPASRTQGISFPNGFGSIVAVSNTWDRFFPDSPENTLTTQPVGVSNKPFGDLIEATFAFQNLVNSGEITYHALTQNSNSYAFTYLDWIGMPRPEPAVPSPASGNTLPVPIPRKL
jgi:hypothetical protein